jgi:hypothetical protein
MSKELEELENWIDENKKVLGTGNSEYLMKLLMQKIRQLKASEREEVKGSVFIHRLNDSTFEELLKYLNIDYEILKKEPFCDTEFKINIKDLDSAIWIGRRFQMNLQYEETTNPPKP